MVTKLDWDVVSSAVVTWQRDKTLSKPGRAFIALSLDVLFDLHGTELISCMTDGGGDRGVDAVYIEEGSVGPRVHILQCKYREKFDKNFKGFPASEIDKTSTFIADLFNRTILGGSSCNPLLLDKCQYVIELMNQSTIVPVDIHYCSNGLPLPPDERARLISATSMSYSHVTLHEHDCRFFAQFLSRLQKRTQLKKIKFDGKVIEENIAGIRGIAGSVRAESLIELLADAKSPTAIDRGMFEENVRLYLGQRNEVNQQIIATASSENRGEFWYLNNGITIVCDGFEYQKGRLSPIVEMRQPQIVNGGQTSYGLFELGNLFREQVAEIKVLVRIVETTDRDLRQRVAIATNSQSAIRGRDLRSNDVMQIQLERALAREGYLYERKRDQHRVKTSTKKVDALKAGQAILAYYKREPHKAKTQSDRIFGELYTFVFDPDWLDQAKVLTAVRLLKEIEDRRDRAIRDFQSRMQPTYSELFLTEAIFHVLFVVGELCRRSGGSLDDFSTAKNHIGSAIKIVSQFFENSGGAAYRVFRVAKTTEALSRLEASYQQLNLSLESD